MEYRDKSIHKLLNSITDTYKKATTNNSRYYIKGSTRIRFSNHYNEHENVSIDIIKLSNGCYCFIDKDFGITSCFYKEDILKFLKNYFSVRNLFESQIKGLRKSLKKTNKKLQKTQASLKNDELRSNLEIANAVYEENINLKKQLKDIKVKLNSFKEIIISNSKTLKKSSDMILDTINNIKTK